MNTIWLNETEERVKLYRAIQSYAAASGNLVECNILSSKDRSVIQTIGAQCEPNELES